jgi:hypothetical protein
VFVYDRITKTKLAVPGNYEWDLLLDPAEVKFMANVSDTSVITANGWTVLPLKKKRVGYWYAEKDLSENSDAHAVRLVPAFCDQSLVQIRDGEAIAYPIPLYSGGVWVKTLFVLVSSDFVTAEFHETHSLEDTASLTEVLFSALAHEGSTVETLSWVQDERNHIVPFPDNVKTYAGDMLEKLLKNVSIKLHVLTENEQLELTLKKRKNMIAAGVGVLVMFLILVASNVIKSREKAKEAQLLLKEQGFQTALALQSREEQVYDLLAHAMNKQPNYAYAINKLYSGTNTLIHRTIVLKLKSKGKKVSLFYVVKGTTFVRLADIRPELKRDMANVGVEMDGSPVIIPERNLVPQVLVSGHFDLAEENKN